ncbi:MAG: M15 family metallopeptidase [Muribaculaceae bacterium]|nr:M15 family metallopeptidase [Muribaculaceae bacterium]
MKACTDRDHLWMSRPLAVASLLVILVLVKSCQGISFLNSREYKIHQLGYPLNEAHTLSLALSDQQVDSLIALQYYDSLACSIVSQQYFIQDHFTRYIAYHKTDTAGTSPTDIVAIVNVNGDNDWEKTAVKCDTTRGYLILVNKYHYLDSTYKRGDMVKFQTTCSYPGNEAARDVVDAFYKMQEDCKKQTQAQLMVNTSYRSFDYQTEVFKIHDKSIVATPGHSEHQTGLSLDITSIEHPEKWSFEKSTEGKWMREHCHEYGFILRYPAGKEHITGYGYEPWHLRYVGVKTASRILSEGITFDEYYAYYIEQTN